MNIRMDKKVCLIWIMYERNRSYGGTQDIMLKITIELVPFGIKNASRKIGEIEIGNDGTSKDKDIGNYVVKLHKSPEYAKKPGIWKKGFVKNFPRKKLGPYDLLYRALKACVSNRNGEKYE